MTAVARRTSLRRAGGVSLSGGLDSSAVVALLAESGVGDLRTYTLGFTDEEDRALDELPLARALAERYGADHHELVVDAHELLDDLPAMTWALDEPYGGGLPSRARFGAIARDAKVVHRLGRRRAVRELPPLRPVREGRLARLRPRDVGRYHAKPSYYFGEDEKRALLREPGPPTAQLLQVFDEVEPQHARLGARLHFSTQLPDEFLHMTDRFSMAHSLEARTPFLDHELRVELVASIPPELRTSADDPKGLLRDASRRCSLPGISARRSAPSSSRSRAGCGTSCVRSPNGSCRTSTSCARASSVRGSPSVTCARTSRCASTRASASGRCSCSSSGTCFTSRRRGTLTRRRSRSATPSRERARRPLRHRRRRAPRGAGDARARLGGARDDTPVGYVLLAHDIPTGTNRKLERPRDARASRWRSSISRPTSPRCPRSSRGGPSHVRAALPEPRRRRLDPADPLARRGHADGRRARRAPRASLDDCVLGAVQDVAVPFVSSPNGVPGWRRRGIPPGTAYFNAGVMLIDVERWAELRVEERALELLREGSEEAVFRRPGPAQHGRRRALAAPRPELERAAAEHVLGRPRPLGRLAERHAPARHGVVLHWAGHRSPGTRGIRPRPTARATSGRGTSGCPTSTCP